MKTITNAAVLSMALLLAGPANAANVKTAGKAVTLCKTFAQETHEGYLRSKSKKIKETRSGYKVKLKVVSEAGSEIVKCSVAKDGTVDYLRADSSKNVANK